MESYQYSESVSLSSVNERGRFLARTYFHLAGAIGAFAALEAYLLNLPGIENLVMKMTQGQYSWLIVLGAFIFISWLAERWANNASSLLTQYLGLLLYIAAEAVIFVPILLMAQTFYPGVIPAAAKATGVLVLLLTAAVFLTRKDFSFLRTALVFCGFAALGLIAAAIVFNFPLGGIFTYAMIGFACLYILYDTSNILHHYSTNQYVGASLALFASIALLFWYILRLFMSRE